ncbi:thioredoxin domain-containing protein [Pseudomonas sp. PB3P13]
MIDLYTAATPNGHKVSIVLEKLSLPCTGLALSVDNKEHRYFKTVQRGLIPNRIDDTSVIQGAQAMLIR